jgi:hypothetical protein
MDQPSGSRTLRPSPGPGEANALEVRDADRFLATGSSPAAISSFDPARQKYHEVSHQIKGFFLVTRVFLMLYDNDTHLQYWMTSHIDVPVQAQTTDLAQMAHCG